ncbi:DUF6366 family protein [Sporolactobacillus shoreicorticis]|uniref:DUF6366 family protein n=1 Tax=Sporolactobacillus shoreicorticis TaxID=1923877 RepID=A0ABW5S3L5_9BACL|nr:DUF6366 family protein [Sporolactobacillus shoreicorticis]MCO7124460.1 DUF6366 family protein [Sporolactobacillus shoreicorticis]
MSKDKETPERRRERLRQEELKKNPMGTMNDAFNKAENGSLADLVGSLDWKGIGILILVITIGFIAASLLLK